MIIPFISTIFTHLCFFMFFIYISTKNILSYPLIFFSFILLILFYLLKIFYLLSQSNFININNAKIMPASRVIKTPEKDKTHWYSQVWPSKAIPEISSKLQSCIEWSDDRSRPAISVAYNIYYIKNQTFLELKQTGYERRVSCI